MPVGVFVLVGSLCLFVALIEAWLLVGLMASPGGALSRLLPARDDLVRSHIDYLLMTLFLYAFYALSRLLGVAPPSWAIGAACFGSFFNPFGFLVHAIRPDFKQAPPPWFFGFMMTSCIATTLGFAATAWTIAGAAL